MHAPKYKLTPLPVATADYLTVEEAAAHMGCKEQTVRNWLSIGKVKGYQWKGRTLLKRADLKKEKV